MDGNYAVRGLRSLLLQVTYYKAICIYELKKDNYLYCEFLTNDIEYYDLSDGQQPTINLYSVPDEAYENQSVIFILIGCYLNLGKT